MNILPADFLEDDSTSSNKSKFSKQQYARKMKALSNSNKIVWDEKFNWKLEQDEIEILSELKRQFADETITKKELQGIIKKSLGSRNPHELILKFCINLKECDTNSLSHLLLETLITEIKSEINDEMKVFAFNHFSLMPRLAFKIAVKAFRLRESKHLFVDKVKKIAKHPWVNQASLVAIELDICDEFLIEDMLVPLFLEDKNTTYLEYMDKAKTLQLLMIKYLDSLMESKNEFENEQLKYNIKRGGIKNLKNIKAHIFKMCKRYGFDQDEVSPIATAYHCGKHLRYIMHEYYENEQLTKDIYEDKIKEIADKNKDLQIMLIELTCERGYVGDGVKWNEHYKLSYDLSKYGHKTVMEFETKADFYSDNFYALPSSVTIIYVDNEELYQQMLQVLKNHDIAGIDCEQQTNNLLSTIQIAVKDCVFVIDTVTLDDWLPKELWIELCKNFFNNSKIVKLGIGIFHDVDTISNGLSIKIFKNSGYVDLNTLLKKCSRKVSDFKLPFQEEKLYEKNKNDIGLSAMTKLCLGKGLNKSYAISNWSIRPLRAQQINYAAIDAYCAIAIFDVINDLLMKQNLNYKIINAEVKKPMQK